MGKIQELFQQTLEPISPESIVKSFEKKIQQYDFDGVTVDGAEVDLEGNIIVSFSDSEGDIMDVLFTNDPDEGVQAIILDDDAEAADDTEDDNADYVVVDLDTLSPSLITPKFTNISYVNLADLSWMNKSALASIFVAGSIGMPEDPDLDGKTSQKDVEDKNGPMKIGVFRAIESVDFDNISELHDHIVYGDSLELINELKKAVVRGGKVVRLSVVRKVRRKVLTSKQKQAIRKAVRKRRLKKQKIKRKLKKALRIRKRRNLQKASLGDFRKVAGTANRKR